MPKSDNKHAIGMYNSIEKHVGHAAAEDFIRALPLSKSADYVKKFKWASGVCPYLEERFSDDEITGFENQLRRIVNNLENEGV